jgi:hypothetical protein
MIDSNWTSGASIMGRDSNGSTKVKDITATGIFQGGAGAFPDGITGADATITGSSSINNLTVTGTFTAAGGFAGNADTATVASNIAIGANRVPYNTSSNNTTSSSNFTFDGTTLSVSALSASSISGNITGNAASASQVNIGGASGSKNVILGGSSGNQSLQADGGLTFNASSNNLSVGGDITAFASDMRLKQNLEQIEGAVAKVCELRGFTYEFNETGRELRLPKGRHLGVSAQEVEKVFPEAVVKRENDNYLTVKYEKLVPVLIEAIKELKDEIESLKTGGYGKS